MTGNSKDIYIYDVYENHLERINYIPDRKEREWHKFSSSPKGDLISLHATNGCIIILSVTTKRCIATLKMNGGLITSCFTPDGRFLLTAGAEHLVYVWDMTTFTCVRKISDNSGSAITSLSVSPDSNYLAVGSHLGIMSIYDFQKVMQQSIVDVKPWKSLMNLTTKIYQSVWHPSGEILAILTDGCHNGIRLVHFPTGRVFSNFPNVQMPLGLVKCINFSSDGSMMTIGCADGKVRLYAIKHYRR